jgi:hypothetical protein
MCQPVPPDGGGVNPPEGEADPPEGEADPPEGEADPRERDVLPGWLVPPDDGVVEAAPGPLAGTTPTPTLLLAALQITPAA